MHLSRKKITDEGQSIAASKSNLDRGHLERLNPRTIANNHLTFIIHIKIPNFPWVLAIEV